MPPATIRDFHTADTDDLYQVCLLTGDSGKDATGLIKETRLLGDVFVGPYLELAADLALVADDGERAAGYAVAALDTAQFERQCETEWWPRLRGGYPTPVPDAEPAGMDAELLAIIQNPALARHPDLPGYPSHLHIDLMEHVRGAGVGNQMLAELFTRLRAAGSPGVHLGVDATNVGAQRFYKRLGFQELMQTGDELFMGLSWTDRES